MNSTFAEVCLALMTLGVWVGIAFLIFTLWQVRRAALAVEMVAYDVGESISRVKAASGRLFDFAAAVRSGWLRSLEMAVGAAAALWPGRRRSNRAEARAAADGD